MNYTGMQLFCVKDCMQKLKMKMLNFYSLSATLVITLFVKFAIGEGKAYKAYEVLKDSTSNSNRYKLALTCLKLNKLAEAEAILLNKRSARPF